ncbi:H-2 class II histocompatibility antigen, A-U alpha chain isoform X2 [Salmo salar]|uniref:H-2 class II histocompatibility antigen, A-U alpha chain isoform X2 n=1 Tax=Salmo salar TaxID=8030 RepID=A0ABM3EEX2_SALSA|nr:H-2 class II histocompatibility antigen, A-U alpha chain isoform X2 [Salmo salar]
MGCRVFLAFILGVCLLSHCQSKHLLRFLTFCQKNVPSDEEYDVEFDGDELFYVDPITYQVERRLSEFAQQWTPDPGLPHEVYVSLGTCQYNIPRCIVGEKSPPEAIEVPTSHIYSQREVELGVPNTLICRVSDFHPTPVDVTWTRNEQPVAERTIIQTQYYSNEDFSFRIFSYLSITPQEGDIYSCSVGHVSLQEPLTRIWEVEVHTDHQTVETAVCVGGVTLGVVGVATGVWFIKKAKRSGWALRT